jgi:hypothetical protein
MKTRLGSKLLMLALLSLGTQTAFAISVTLGQQDFADGATPTPAAFLAAGAGEPVPFDGVFIGSDASGPNFSASWTFSYAAPLSNVTAGSLILGIFDHDSAATGDQVASFTLNGIDLTATLNSLFESHGGANREDNVYTLTLPSLTFAALATGTATFALSLKDPGLGILGETSFNGAALDFSTLDVTSQGTQPPPQAPEPSTASLMLAAFSWLIMRRHKKA